MVLVSHKTRKPYKGPATIFIMAWKWLDKYQFFFKNGLNWTEDQVYFENSKQEKVERIIELGCTHYIDDLPEIIEMLPSNINKIIYTNGKSIKMRGAIEMHHWNEAEFLCGKV